MHDLNVIILGPAFFVSTLDELKPFLKFNTTTDYTNNNSDIILFHTDILKDKVKKDFIDKSSLIKICAYNNKKILGNYDTFLELPSSINEINTVVENIAAKKKFNKNSSIKIKDYYLDKNEKKLSKLGQFINLTEKEIHLLDLFFNSKNPVSKDKILSSVWNYSSDADTHTVETHIYRLRKKINDKFTDEKFILNNKSGYYL
tara:strand:+ start:80 stop:685 length:606 start_codon:yes stop_codon:yes gene_type:complete